VALQNIARWNVASRNVAGLIIASRNVAFRIVASQNVSRWIVASLNVANRYIASRNLESLIIATSFRDSSPKNHFQITVYLFVRKMKSFTDPPSIFQVDSGRMISLETELISSTSVSPMRMSSAEKLNFYCFHLRRLFKN